MAKTRPITMQEIMEGNIPTGEQIQVLYDEARDEIVTAERKIRLAQMKIGLLQGICKHPNLADSWVCPDCGLDTE